MEGMTMLALIVNMPVALAVIYVIIAIKID